MGNSVNPLKKSQEFMYQPYKDRSILEWHIKEHIKSSRRLNAISGCDLIQGTYATTAAEVATTHLTPGHLQSVSWAWSPGH